MRTFDLVVPAYNEARSLPAIVQRAAEAARAANFTPDRFRLIVVNNGSRDDSSEVLETLSRSEWGRWFTSVNVKKNKGYGFGIWQGLQASEADFVGWTHADQQCDPADAFGAYAVAAESSGARLLVKGERRGRDWKDRFVSRVFEAWSSLVLGVQLREINAQPKVFPRPLLRHLISPPDGFAFDLYVLYRALKAGYVIKGIPVLFPPRVHGVSHWASTFVGRYKTIARLAFYAVQLRLKEEVQ